jgi:3-dehydroquinate synthase
MRDTFEVASALGRYPIRSGSGLLAEVVSQHPDSIFLVDSRLAARLPTAISKIILLEATEVNKSLEHVPEIITRMQAQGANRSSHLVAIGGGVMQDLATFVASIYMRGIPWTYMPTTLLAMADSCIGGKSSINVQGLKNLVGNFYPPTDIQIDLDFVASLNREQTVSGLFEAVKICYARGPQAFHDLLAVDTRFPLSADNAQRIIMHALRTKQWFIEVDEFDQKERLLLNYGHTFGHAIEACTDFAVPHGIAVGLGVLITIDYSIRHKLLSAAGLERALQLKDATLNLLKDVVDALRTPLARLNDADMLKRFGADKKHRADHYRIIVPAGDGALELISLPRTAATDAGITLSWRSVFDAL